MGHVIAIDGPAGAGKSTIARALAETLGYTYIDTGAMYRAVALLATRHHIQLDDEHRLQQVATAARIELLPQRRVLLDGEDVSEAIRQADIAVAASKVAAIAGVRTALVAKQRAVALSASVVMEGRDIGTVVFPEARVKIFLDADPAERVRRRCGEQPQVSVETLAAQIAERDRRDRQRVESPLVQAQDAIYLDSTGLSAEQVIEQILRIVRSRHLLVMKFGGTSVGSADRMKAACDLIASAASGRPVVAVVSAMSKITDLLLDTTRHAEADDQASIDLGLQQLQTRHFDAARELGLAAIQPELEAVIGDFRRIVSGMQMLGHRPPRAVDEAIAVGERLSALLVAGYLQSRGLAAEAVNAADAIVTDAIFNNASPQLELTRIKACGRLNPLLEAGVIPIVTGFNGATVDGRPTTLGRGGSDFSASILAASLGASELWIWTDVDGIMTADPRLVKEAKVLDEITYSEAAELAYAGAKVLHPRTLAPLVEHGIPVWSKNSFAPEKPGTRIVPTLSIGNAGARAVTSMAGVALISLDGGGVHIMARCLDALDRTNVEILAISSSSYRQSFCFLVRKEEVAAASDAIEAALALELTHGYVKPAEIDSNVGLLAVVGEGMRGSSGMAGRIFTAISRENVNIIAIAQGSSELTISIVVRRDGLDKAVRAVHAECHL